jgi:hypothetical protein
MMTLTTVLLDPDDRADALYGRLSRVFFFGPAGEVLARSAREKKLTFFGFDRPPRALTFVAAWRSRAVTNTAWTVEIFIMVCDKSEFAQVGMFVTTPFLGDFSPPSALLRSFRLI